MKMVYKHLKIIRMVKYLVEELRSPVWIVFSNPCWLPKAQIKEEDLTA